MNKEVVKFVDVLTNPELLEEPLVGRKAAFLRGVLELEDELVPPFFVVTTQPFKKLLTYLGDFETDVESLVKLQNRVNHFNFDEVFVQNVKNAYKSLGRFFSPTVVVRGSVSAHGYPDVSFGGVFPTYMGVKGVEDVLQSIRWVWASYFRQKTWEYIRFHNLDWTKVSLAVMVQKLIVPEVSGVAYIFDPLTKQADHITIEAVYGIGDVIAYGEINPDIYIVDKRKLIILEKKINPQYWMRTYINRPVMFSLENTTRVELAKVWHTTPKLSDDQIEKLATIVRNIAEKYNGMVVEWAYANGRFWVLQIKGTPRSLSKQPELKGKDKYPILIGLPLAYGQVVGKTFVITNETLEQYSFEELVKKAKGKILVTPRFYNILRELVVKARVKGVVLEVGSPSSDAAYYLEELGVPAVGGTFNATRVLKDDMTVLVDGKSGAVYLVSEEE